MIQRYGGINLLGGLLEPLLRFPVPALFVFTTTFVNVLYLPPETENADAVAVFNFFAIAAFFLSWAIGVWASAYQRKTLGVILGLFSALCLGFTFDLPNVIISLLNNNSFPDYSTPTISHAMLIGAFALSTSFAPYVTHKAPPDVVWQYVHKWVVSFIAAVFGFLLVYLCFAAIIYTLNILAGENYSEIFYRKVFVLSFSFTFPWILLLLSPKKYNETFKTGDEKEFTSRAIGLIVLYILIPLSTIVSLILAVYTVKILFTGSFEASRLVFLSFYCGFSIFLTAIMAYPQRIESATVRLFWRVWPYLLIPVMLLFFTAFSVRIETYGWTPFRYFVFLIGLWIAISGFLQIFPQTSNNLRFPLILLAVLLAGTSFGPHGIAEVSARSQFSRLEKLLVAKGALVDGKLLNRDVNWDSKQTEPSVSYIRPDLETAATALKILRDTRQLNRVEPWFAGRLYGPITNDSIDDRYAEILQILNLPTNKTEIERRNTQEYVHFHPDNPYAVKYEQSGRQVGHFTLENEDRPVRQTEISGPEGLHLELADRRLTISVEGKGEEVFDLHPVLASIPRPVLTPEFQNPLLIDGTGKLNVSIVVYRLSGYRDQRQSGLRVGFYVFLKDGN